MGGWKNLPQHHPCSGYSGTPGALGSREDYGWPHSAWSAFGEAIRTNNVVEGWHRRLNERASHGQLNIYQVVSIMHTAQRGRVRQPAGVPGFEAEVEKTPTTNVRTVPGAPLQPEDTVHCWRADRLPAVGCMCEGAWIVCCRRVAYHTPTALCIVCSRHVA